MGTRKIDAESTFALLAELALALAGFGGVAAAFGGSGRQYAAAELTRLRALFTHASVVLAASLLCQSLLWFGQSSDSAAFWACTLGFVVMAPAAAYYSRQAYRFAADPQNTTTWLVFVAIIMPTWTALGMYAAGIASGDRMGFLVLGLSIQLLLGVWVFFRVLTLRD